MARFEETPDAPMSQSIGQPAWRYGVLSWLVYTPFSWDSKLSSCRNLSLFRDLWSRYYVSSAFTRRPQTFLPGNQEKEFYLDLHRQIADFYAFAGNSKVHMINCTWYRWYEKVYKTLVERFLYYLLHEKNFLDFCLFNYIFLENRKLHKNPQSIVEFHSLELNFTH